MPLFGVLQTLDFLHRNQTVHRDLKPENLLVDRKGYLKVIDLGFCKVLRTCHGRSFTFCGTPEYMAPELFMFLPHSEAVDMWALGCLLYELATLRSPFYSAGLNFYMLGKRIMSRQFEPLGDVSPQLIELVDRMLALDPSDRPTAAEVHAIAAEMVGPAANK